MVLDVVSFLPAVSLVAQCLVVVHGACADDFACGHEVKWEPVPFVMG